MPVRTRPLCFFLVSLSHTLYDANCVIPTFYLRDSDDAGAIGVGFVVLDRRYDQLHCSRKGITTEGIIENDECDRVRSRTFVVHHIYVTQYCDIIFMYIDFVLPLHAFGSSYDVAFLVVNILIDDFVQQRISRL